jgi:hypothetical protein
MIEGKNVGQGILYQYYDESDSTSLRNYLP